jgi:hypothetical protein
MTRSVKTTRLLEALGVEEELDSGKRVVVLEATFLLADGQSARLAFERNEEGQLCVGYAIDRDGQWEVQEAERFSVRTLGYYRRRLKRIGERAPLEDDWDEDADED